MREFGVKVTVVAPGAFRTSFFNARITRHRKKPH
ncbi:hypothetical protein NAF17_03600 [Mucilaginibacter sp. RB4R14]|nr:hypothetical protein [Mucilaginibacter aurantiaciroseus]MCO5934616.1 hypothetical protein [Mucilaginibacter aurantiaciroseus]